MVLAIIIHHESKRVLGSEDYKANAEVAIKEDTRRRRLEIPHTNGDNIRRDQNIPFALKKVLIRLKIVGKS